MAVDVWVSTVFEGSATTWLLPGCAVGFVDLDAVATVEDAVSAVNGRVRTGRTISFARVSATGEPPGMTVLHCSTAAIPGSRSVRSGINQSSTGFTETKAVVIVVVLPSTTTVDVVDKVYEPCLVSRRPV